MRGELLCNDFAGELCEVEAFCHGRCRRLDRPVYSSRGRRSHVLAEALSVWAWSRVVQADVSCKFAILLFFWARGCVLFLIGIFCSNFDSECSSSAFFPHRKFRTLMLNAEHLPLPKVLTSRLPKGTSPPPRTLFHTSQKDLLIDLPYKTHHKSRREILMRINRIVHRRPFMLPAFWAAVCQECCRAP